MWRSPPRRTSSLNGCRKSVLPKKSTPRILRSFVITPNMGSITEIATIAASKQLAPLRKNPRCGIWCIILTLPLTLRKCRDGRRICPCPFLGAGSPCATPKWMRPPRLGWLPPAAVPPTPLPSAPHSANGVLDAASSWSSLSSSSLRKAPRASSCADSSINCMMDIA